MVKKTQTDSRENRLAKALRANLKRRKQAAREAKARDDGAGGAKRGAEKSD